MWVPGLVSRGPAAQNLGCKAEEVMLPPTHQPWIRSNLAVRHLTQNPPATCPLDGYLAMAVPWFLHPADAHCWVAAPISRLGRHLLRPYIHQLCHQSMSISRGLPVYSHFLLLDRGAAIALCYVEAMASRQMLSTQATAPASALSNHSCRAAVCFVASRESATMLIKLSRQPNFWSFCSAVEGITHCCPADAS